MSLQPYPGNAGWPVDWQGSRFTGKFLSITGVPVQGTVTFTPTATAVISGVTKTIIIGATVSVPLAQGAFDVVLPASDDPDMNPTGWTYQVVENFPGGRKYHVSAPVNGTQDLSAVSPVPAANGVSIVRGKSAYEIAVEQGFVGTEAQWIASLGGGGGGGGSILSVNGKTGTVVLNAADVGAAPSVHTHSAANIGDSTSVGRAVLTAADAAAARGAIGAGTSSLQLGATSTTAKAGDYKPPVADLPAGAVLYTSGTSRPTARTDVCVIFTGSSDPGSAALTGDVWIRAS